MITNKHEQYKHIDPFLATNKTQTIQNSPRVDSIMKFTEEWNKTKIKNQQVNNNENTKLFTSLNTPSMSILEINSRKNLTKPYEIVKRNLNIAPS